MTKERPIIFSAPMVRAILDGSKSQTRRVINPQPLHPVRDGNLSIADKHSHPYYKGMRGIRCPYDVDRLWVRETFRLFDSSDECGCSESPCNCPENNSPLYRANGNDSESKWKPSIHMPRWASRINLEIANIRIERLNDISEEDAKSEGVCEIGIETGRFDVNGHPIEAGSYLASFCDLWESINGQGSWDQNPWVWRISFVKI